MISKGMLQDYQNTWGKGLPIGAAGAFACAFAVLPSAIIGWALIFILNSIHPAWPQDQLMHNIAIIYMPIFAPYWVGAFVQLLVAMFIAQDMKAGSTPKG